VAELARQRAQSIDPDTMADMRERWETFGDRIYDLALGVVDAIDGGESRWGTPLWKKQRGES
jgi:hypothetical protein